MQIHPSTKKLIDRLYDMTLERKSSGNKVRTELSCMRLSATG